MASISDQQRPTSQGAKVVQCCRCRTDIQPYAGRRVALLDRFAHQSGACSMPSSRPQVALQGALPFSWSCHRIEVGATDPVICDIAGSDPIEYSQHMRTAHAAHPLKPSTPKIKLRFSTPNAKLPAAEVPAPLKRLEWTEKHYSEWQAGVGQTCTETQYRGQFWGNAGPHEVWAIVDMRGKGQPNKLVKLYVDGSGGVTPDWSGAASSRRSANQRKARAA